jgi:restriction system protein
MLCSGKVLEVVSLDDMDWFEFEQFVAHLFERLGLGKTKEIRKGRDAGKDIILRSSQGLVIVECKHHPKGSVGRPVVQKLHSAVITAQAKKGFLVTTGHFSENATTYARSLGSIIELVDSRILSDMANKARIRVLKKGEKTSVFHVLPPPQKFVEQKMLSNIVGNAFSFPYTPSQLSKTEVIKTHFVPAYLLEYRLHQNFSTTVGTIHRIHVDRERLFLNGQDGSIIASQLSRMVSPTSMVEDYYPVDQKDVSSGSFKIGYSTAKRLGVRHIQKLHTNMVGYYGANNVHYTKKCTPNISNILVRSLTQVYIPVLSVSFQIIARKHKISLCGNPEAIEIVEGAVYNCEVCGNTLPQKRLLCNSCGKIVHKPRIILGHSYFCKLCKKTICIECAYWFRKYLFFKKKVCKNCAEKLKKDGITVKKLSPSALIT